MWEQEPGSGRVQAKECGGVSDRSEGDGMVEGDLETGRASGLERCRKRNPKTGSCQMSEMLWLQ